MNKPPSIFISKILVYQQRPLQDNKYKCQSLYLKYEQIESLFLYLSLNHGPLNIVVVSHIIKFGILYTKVDQICWNQKLAIRSKYKLRSTTQYGALGLGIYKR